MQENKNLVVNTIRDNINEDKVINLQEIRDEQDLKSITLDKYSFDEEERAKIEEIYLNTKKLILYNIKEYSKGKNLRNVKKVNSLKILRELDKTIYKDIDSYIEAVLENQKLGKDEDGKETISWEKAVKNL